MYLPSRYLLLGGLFAVGLAVWPVPGSANIREQPAPLPTHGKLDLTDAEWRARLTEQQFRVMRLGKTERAFSGAYWKHDEPGVYRCAACGQALFHSEQKFDSGNGWPSFSDPLNGEVLELRTKTAFGKKRFDLKCSRCSSHVGFAYEDGPKPSGLRHTLNSVALRFEDEATWKQTDAKRRKKAGAKEAPEPAAEPSLDPATAPGVNAPDGATRSQPLR